VLFERKGNFNLIQMTFSVDIVSGLLFTKDRQFQWVYGQLLLAKASELVAVLPSTREWRFIETQRLAG